MIFEQDAILNRRPTLPETFFYSLLTLLIYSNKYKVSVQLCPCVYFLLSVWKTIIGPRQGF